MKSLKCLNLIGLTEELGGHGFRERRRLATNQLFALNRHINLRELWLDHSGHASEGKKEGNTKTLDTGPSGTYRVKGLL